jgi:putative redox protein
MVNLKIVYTGQLRCEAEHGPSGNKLITNAPVDNHGKGETFSPTDLLAVSLGSCIMTVMGIVAEHDNVDLIGTTINVTKEMVNKPIRRIGKLTVIINVPNKISPENQLKLEKTADACPVKQSLHPDVVIDMRFNWA